MFTWILRFLANATFSIVVSLRTAWKPHRFMHILYEEMHKRGSISGWQGEAACLYTGVGKRSQRKAVYFVKSQTLANRVMKDAASFRRCPGPAKFSLPRLCPDSILFAGEDPQRWTYAKKILAPKILKLKKLAPELANVMVQKLEVGHNVDLFMNLIKATALASCQVFFGQDLRALVEKRFGSYDGYMEKVAAAFSDTLGVNPKYVKLDDDFFDSNKGMMDEILRKAPKGTIGYDMLQMALDETKPLFTFDMARDNSFLDIAGPCAGAVALYWSLVSLNRNPDCLDKLQLSVQDNSILQSGSSLARMVFKESCRLFPPVAFIAREANHDVALQSGCIIPKGSKLFVFPSHLSSVDSRFLPERWDRKDCIRQSSTTTEGAYYAPYGDGSHGCAGQFVMSDFLECALVQLVTHYDFTLQHPIIDGKSDQDLALLPPALQSEGHFSGFFPPQKPHRQYCIRHRGHSCK